MALPEIIEYEIESSLIVILFVLLPNFHEEFLGILPVRPPESIVSHVGPLLVLFVEDVQHVF